MNSVKKLDTIVSRAKRAIDVIQSQFVRSFLSPLLRSSFVSQNIVKHLQSRMTLNANATAFGGRLLRSRRRSQRQIVEHALDVLRMTLNWRQREEF